MRKYSGKSASTGEKRLDDLDFFDAQSRGAQPRRGDLGRRQVGLSQALLLHDDRARDEIAQPLVARREEDGQHTHRIDTGHLIDDAEEVAEQRVKCA